METSGAVDTCSHLSDEGFIFTVINRVFKLESAQERAFDSLRLRLKINASVLH